MSTSTDKDCSTTPAAVAEASRLDNPTKRPFSAPKLTFVPPQLTRQGTIEELTAGMLGDFSP